MNPCSECKHCSDGQCNHSHNVYQHFDFSAGPKTTADLQAPTKMRRFSIQVLRSGDTKCAREGKWFEAK